MNEFQEQIYKTIDILVEEKLKTLKFNRSKKGKVLSVNGNSCIVEIDGESYTCKIRKDLQVVVNDIVYVSYPENDESDKYVDIVLGDNIAISGHMLKQDYDSDEDGKVDLAEHADTATSANYANEAGTSSDSNTVNGHTVESDVPSGAKFTDTIYSHPSTHPYSMITGTPSSLPANGGNASTVNGYTVASNVPSGAKFTDTVYRHPSTHPYSMITGTPSSLPANGGNADTVDGKHASAFVPTMFVNGSSRIYRNCGGLYTASSNSTGAIVIDVGTQNIMISLTVTLRSYYNIAQLTFGGYTYQSSSNWHSPQATGFIDGNASPINIRFQANGSGRYIVIGDTNTSWGGYLHVTIDEIQNGYGGTVNTPFSVSLATSYPGTTRSTFKIGELHTNGVINKHYNNTSYTTGQGRNIILSTGNPSGGGNGDVWIKYT